MGDPIPRAAPARLELRSARRASFEPVIGLRALRRTVIGVSMAMLAGAVIVLAATRELTTGALLIGLAGALMLTGAVWRLRPIGTILFDRQVGAMWTREASEAGDDDQPGPDQAIRVDLAGLRAVEVVPFRARDAEGEFDAWGLELLLEGEPARRAQVIAHGAEDALRRDAEKLARFLDVPVVQTPPPPQRPGR
jgi:hypothetical protein